MSKIVNKDINLRDEMSELIDGSQYEVLVQRTSQKIRCSCFNEKYGEPDAKCSKCIGTGWLFKFERHKTFKQDIIANNDGDILVTPLGQLVQGYVKFFFTHDVLISQNDYIWEVAWKNNKPIKLVALYQIKSHSDQRGSSGTIEYKYAIAEKEAFDKDFKNMYIGKAWRDI